MTKPIVLVLESIPRNRGLAPVLLGSKHILVLDADEFLNLFLVKLFHEFHPHLHLLPLLFQFTILLLKFPVPCTQIIQLIHALGLLTQDLKLLGETFILEFKLLNIILELHILILQIFILSLQLLRIS